MRKELAAAWAKALRSGRYKQTTGTLGASLPSGSKAYCCLGVLCRVALNTKAPEIAGLEKQVRNGISDFDSLSTFELRIKGRVLSLIKLFGMTRGKQTKFISMNDDYRKNFKEIADEVEKTYVK